MNFNLHPQQQQQQQGFENVTSLSGANQTTYAAPICTPTGHTFGHHQQHHIPHQSPITNPHTQHVFYHHHHYDYYWTPYQQQQQHQQQVVSTPPPPAQFQMPPTSAPWVPPDPFVPVFEERPHKSPVQPKEQILEEIVRECEEIERRSSSGGSPASSVWSSDERDETATPEETPSYHPYKTPERKERKKAQNRLAATRYREKKRREKEETMGCIEDLSATNGTLKATVSELEKEITYLKKLMNELGITPDQQSS